MAEPEYPVLRELETKLKLQWVDTNDYLATQRAIIQVEPDHAYLELPRGRKGDKGDPGPAISIQGIVAADSQLPANAEIGHAYVNTSTKGLAIWNGSQWFKVNNFAGVDADLQQFSRWFAQIESDARRAVDAAERAEFAAEETIQQVEGDFATRNYVDNAVWSKPPLTAESNADALTSGVYPVPNSAVASALGLPEDTQGEIVHYELDASRLHRRQHYRADAVGVQITDYRRTYYNGTWREWELVSVPYFRGQVPSGLSPEDLQGPKFEGTWSFNSSQSAAWGLPSHAAGFIRISATATSTLQEITSLVTPVARFSRRSYLGEWSSDWQKEGVSSEPGDTGEYSTATSRDAIDLLIPSVVDPTLSYVSDHAALVDDLKSRLGTVSTGGKAAIALVADHGTTAFKEWMWAEAKSRNIPFTMALAPEIHLDGKGDSRHTASNDDIKQWISEGLVIASHSGDHGGALGYFDVSRQIKTSKAKLEEKLETTVDCWVQPGYSLALGNYDGFATGQSAQRYTDYYAGRLLQQTYSVITGYAGDDFVYPGGVDLPVGVRRSLTERKDAYPGVLIHIQQAIDTGGKHINFCHPYAIPDSSSTYVTKSEYISYLDWLAQKRDAGDLVLLTLPELAIAQ